MNIFRDRPKMLFPYSGHMGRLGECRVDILSKECNKFIVVFTELDSNKGPSITNAMEYLIPQFCKAFGILAENITFIERYYSHPQDLDLVEYSPNAEISWRRLAEEETEPILQLLDRPYSDNAIPSWCRLPHSDHLVVGGCWGISSGEVAITNGKHCETCEFKD